MNRTRWNLEGVEDEEPITIKDPIDEDVMYVETKFEESPMKKKKNIEECLKKRT